MAVDFSLLPQEQTQPIEAPSRLAWTVAFVLMILAGVFAVLILWPKDLPTQTLKFWVTLVLFPVGIPALIVLRRYSIYEGRKLDAEMQNEATRNFNARVFEAASVPFAVLGSAHRISVDARENSPARIKEGAVTLKAQEPIATLGEVVKARWLGAPGMQKTPGGKEADLRRRHFVTKWLFNQLLDDLLPNLAALPVRIPLTVHLSVANGLTSKENEAHWMTCWDERTSHSISAIHSAEPSTDLMILDRWMDAAITDKDSPVTVLIAVQLNPLLAETPLPGTAEAGVALILAPDSLASRHALARLCNLHRPVRRITDQPNEAVAHALQWANATADRIATAWQTGLDATHTGALRKSARTLALNPRVTDLDQTVGHAGIAAPWLAVSCAASTPCSDSGEQPIFVGQGGKVDCAILKHPHVTRPVNQAMPVET